jgi:hypothetical protein
VGAGLWILALAGTALVVVGGSLIVGGRAGDG